MHTADRPALNYIYRFDKVGCKSRLVNTVKFEFSLIQSLKTGIRLDSKFKTTVESVTPPVRRRLVEEGCLF